MNYSALDLGLDDLGLDDLYYDEECIWEEDYEHQYTNDDLYELPF
jgi:hypothetical protein